MTAESHAGAESLLGAPPLPRVVVLGAGGLARRLAVGSLREHGVAIEEGTEPPTTAAACEQVGTGEPPQAVAVRTAGVAAARAFCRDGASNDGDGGSVVGLLVEPSNDDWVAATAYRIPLVALMLDEPSDDCVVDSVLRGADAVVSAHDEPEEIVSVISAVAGGETLVSPRQARCITDAARGRRRDPGPVDPLTGRELDILLSIDRGETVKQTARALGISAKTVENLQSRLFRKLGVRNRAQAVSRAHALGLLLEAAGTAPDVPPLANR